jgi:hypothetical protein
MAGLSVKEEASKGLRLDASVVGPREHLNEVSARAVLKGAIAAATGLTVDDDESKFPQPAEFESIRLRYWISRCLKASCSPFFHVLGSY